MLLTTYKPVSGLSYLLDNVFNSNWEGRQSPATATPASYVSEKDGVYQVEVDLPGVKKENITVNVENGVLSIKATRKRGESEIQYERSFRMADDLAVDSIRASHVDGILTLSVSRKEEAAPKRIEIQ